MMIRRAGKQLSSATGSSSSSTTATTGKAAVASRTPRRRCLHQRVPLPYPIDDGVGEFLKPAALQRIAVEWQEGVLNKLNELTRGTNHASQSVLQTLKETASDPSKALIFNYASEALNTSFFLSTLKPRSPGSTDATEPKPNSLFSQQVSHSSLRSYAGLVSHLSAHVAGLHPSSGAYVWLAADQTGRLGVFGTYAGGTLLVQGGRGLHNAGTDTVIGERIEPPSSTSEDASTSTPSEKAPPAKEEVWRTTPPSSANTSSKGGRQSPSNRGFDASSLIPPSALTSRFNDHLAPRMLHPLLCLSLHPHCYLPEYGVWGREEYLRRWWRHVDWSQVERTYSDLVAYNKS